MAKIKSQDTKPEIKLRKALWHLGFRYRKNEKLLPGKPDVVFRKGKLAIFIDGEFWHGYQWKDKKLKIRSNRDFWIPKIERNMQRDDENNEILKENGWCVMRIWEHEIKNNFDEIVNRITQYLEEKK
jgi:DNA mismatch endonuclease (patch repair protein)